MNIALLTDTHWGVRGNAPVYLDALADMLKTQFFPLLKKRGISHIAFLGDVFDSRKSINVKTIDHFREHFLNVLESENMTCDIIVGNHDCHYSDTNSVNSVSGIIGDHQPGIRVFTEPGEINVNGHQVLGLPWVNPENIEHTLKSIKSSKSNICLGHIEIAGSYNGPGRTYEEGFGRKLFERFSLVVSGHIHHRSRDRNLVYLGAPYEMTWDDAGHPRGFGILNLDTAELEFIDNEKPIYRTVEFGSKVKLTADQIVRIVISENPSAQALAKFLQSVNVQNPSSVEVVDKNILQLVSTKQRLEPITDTLDIMMRYIEEQVTGPIDKTKLKSLMETTYKGIINE